MRHFILNPGPIREVNGAPAAKAAGCIWAARYYEIGTTTRIYYADEPTTADLNQMRAFLFAPEAPGLDALELDRGPRPGGDTSRSDAGSQPKTGA